jgi:hypothetical protein
MGGPLIPGRIYRIQVGSYKEVRNAVSAFDKLTNAGLQPKYERYNRSPNDTQSSSLVNDVGMISSQSFYRVVLPGVRSEDIPAVAAKLGSVGFVEAVARLEGVEMYDIE